MMLKDHLLSLLIWLPIVGGFVVLSLGERGRAARWLALNLRKRLPYRPDSVRERSSALCDVSPPNLAVLKRHRLFVWLVSGPPVHRYDRGRRQ